VTRLPPNQEGASGFGFDALAARYEARSGLPAGVAARVARAVTEIATARRGDWLVELGPGTGEVGARLAQVWPGRYLALDLSLAMLAQFRRRAGPPAPHPGAVRWLQADAAASWPLGAPLRAVFCARAAHLLGAARLTEEVLARRHSRGTWLLLGRVERQPTSVRAGLRREMRRALAAAGREARDGAGSRRDLVARLEDFGGRPRPPREVAAWPVRERPRDALRAWRERPGLAGLAERDLPAQVKRELLAHLESWALRRFGDLDRETETTVRYELTAIELPGDRGRRSPRRPVKHYR
jgi:hypothetical protein